MDGQPTARSSMSALLWGCEGLGQIRTAKSQVDLKSHQHLNEVLQGAMGDPSALLSFLHEA